MGKTLRFVTTVVVVAGLLVNGVQAEAAAVKIGAKCSKLSAKAKTSTKQTVVCAKKSGKLKWVAVNGASAGGSGSGITGSGDYLSDPNVSTLALYSGGPGPGGTAGIPTAKSVPLPSAVPTGAAQVNVRLWVYDPEHPSLAAGSSGVFVNDSKGWVFHNLDASGYLLETFTPGTYSIDTVEPNGNSAKYKRHTYTLRIAADGSATIDGLLANADGFFTLSLDLVTATKVDQYNPVTPCQLQYQVADDNTLSSGFPRKSARLPNHGTVKALIVPVDFTDVPGQGDPATVFFDMAKGTHDFYKTMSAGSVIFNFKVVKNWQRQAFPATKYNLGNWSGGDSMGYYKALVAAADPIVDYSQFDVVYFLSPPSMPWKTIAYGPAFPTTVDTADGPLHAGTFSGADAYSNTSIHGDGWKWMSHETGHLFGLQDLYTNGVDSTFGAWDIMSLNWTNEFIELNAWNRYISDWLTNQQIDCITPDSLTASGTQLLLDPIERTNTKVKAVAIPINSYTILVVESRRAEGMDHSSAQQPAGTIVYTVDMRVRSIKGGWHLITPPRSLDKNQFTDGALKAGESVSVAGITIKIVSQDATGDTVLVSK